MAGTKEIKRRIKSVKNTKKITKAMELVAASKMKRALANTLAARPYAEYSWDVLTSVARSIEENYHPLFTERIKEDAKQNVLLVLITSNRGLCGAYNAQVTKKALTTLKTSATNIDVVSIGKKGDTSMRRVGKNIIASFSELPDHISLVDVLPISKFLIDEFTAAHYDMVYIAYTDYVSALTQRPKIKQILPVSKTSLKELINNLAPDSEENGKQKTEDKKINYLVEGEMNTLIGSLAEKITRMQIYQMLLESNASEQSARMVAMKNASDASGEMIEDLTLVFNKARQANITREISEISAGMASVS